MKNDPGSVAPLYREFSTELYEPRAYATTCRIFTADLLFTALDTQFQLSPLLNVNHPEILDAL
jgi:hypothetical protein